ncbi:MAG TPA: adenylate/guanylate cyclase domain-containing protein [Actinomycetota bacterium]|nr:adenylate/guanylate cyclase domain-containing protein [Actinomycetota bacterium]
MSACGRCGAATPAGARFCPGCGSPLSGVPAGDTLKTVSVVFTDLVGSTALAERFDPESLHTLMREYFETIRRVVTRYGGSVEKFIGDAVVAVFGVPTLHEDDALRAVTAAAAIHRAIDELSARLDRDAGVTLEVRTGVNTGEVLSQPDGTSGRLVGDAVNLAARLQQAAAPGQVLLGPSTQDLVAHRVRSEALEPFLVKGKAAPVRAHRLVEVLPAARGTAPKRTIVGRDREARLLRETLQRVVEEHTPHLFTVLGSAGIGKSRLVAELEDAGEAVVLHGRCLPYGEGITYWPLAEIVQRAAGIDSGDPPDVARGKLVASAGGDPESETVAERMAQVFALEESPGTTDDLSWAVRKYFEHLAVERPHVLVFDDVHWGETALLDLVEQLVDSLADVPLLIVCVARLELLDVRPAWGGGKLNASSLVLGPLKEPECRALIGSLLGESPSLDEVTDAVFRVADGNPLFVEEMVSMLVDHGFLDRAGGPWAATRDLASLSVPPTIQALVSARLDRLTREEREVVGVAAVMGKVFASSAVGDLIGGRVDEALDRLTRKQLLAPEGTEFAGRRTYSFRHLLIRDTAYEHLPRMKRASIHERYADWLVDALGDRVAEYDEIVGYHLEQAHQYQSNLGGLAAGGSNLATRAADRLAEGGRRALARQDVTAAVKLLSRAAELLPGDDEKRLSVLPELGRALFESGSYAPAMEAFEEAIELGTKLGDERVATTSTVFNERVRVHSDPHVNAEELESVAQHAIAVLSDLGDDYGLCYAWDLAAYAHDCAGRSDDALAAFRKAAEHAERSGVRSLIGYQKRALVRSLAWGSGHVSEILALGGELLEWARKVGDRYSEARALLSLGQAHAMLGEFDLARGYVAQQREVCADVSFAFIDASGAFERSQVELLAGDLDAAEAEARGGCETLQKMGEKGVLPTLQAHLADIAYARGQDGAALRLVETARGLSAPDDSLTAMRWRAVLAKILARRGDVLAATELLDDARSIAAETGYLDWHAGLLVDVAEVMTTAQRPVDATKALRAAIDLYGRKGNLVAQRAAEGRLRRVVPA